MLLLCTSPGIEERIARWSLLPVANQESLQVLKYGAGQQYRPHWDFFQVGGNMWKGTGWAESTGPATVPPNLMNQCEQ
jgi:hypothetical protein